MSKVFIYGTLQDEKIQQQIFGRILQGSEDSLNGYHLGKITIPCDETGSIYPAIRKSETKEDIVSGVVYELSKTDLKKADEYEGKNYKREKVQLSSGAEAWAFIAD